jgi:hypothetical protein
MEHPETVEKYPGDLDAVVSSVSEGVREFLNLTASEQLERVRERLPERSPLREAVAELRETQREMEADDVRKAREEAESAPYSAKYAIAAQFTAARLDRVLLALELQVLDIILDDAVNPLGFSARPILDGYRLSDHNIRDSVSRALRVAFYGPDNRGRRRSFPTRDDRREFLALYNRFSLVVEGARRRMRDRLKELKRTKTHPRPKEEAIREVMARFEIPPRYEGDLFGTKTPKRALVFKWIQEWLGDGDPNDKDVESTYKRTLIDAKEEWESSPEGVGTVLVEYIPFPDGIALVRSVERKSATDDNERFTGRFGNPTRG